jgi:hypothetical protein
MIDKLLHCPIIQPAATMFELNEVSSQLGVRIAFLEKQCALRRERSPVAS